MRPDVLTVALWCLAVAALVAVILLARQRQITTQLFKRTAELEDDVRVRDEELWHLVANRLPALAESLRQLPVEVPGPLHVRLNGTDYAQSIESVLNQVNDSAAEARTRTDQSAKSTLKSMMRIVQSLGNEQQLVISNMQDRHDNPEVLEDLLKIDHMNSQLGRRAQATAVLCGSWPGQQRSASTLTDVVRGATSRIRDYLRVQVHGQVETAVVSRAVEPTVLAIAELLDNAARHSQPNISVEVNFQSAHNGMAVMIDDAGVGMNPEIVQHATRLLSGRQAVDINKLGDPPQIGFAVIGVLSARYGFTVSVDTQSPYGGVRAVVFLPNALLTRANHKPERVRSVRGNASTSPNPPANPSPPALGSAPPETAPAAAQPAESQVPESTASGLPKRRRQSVSEQPTVREPVQATAKPSRSARKTAAGMGAWQRGTRSGRITQPDSDSEENQA